MLGGGFFCFEQEVLVSPGFGCENFLEGIDSSLMFRRIASYALGLLAFAIPFEHKYDKLFRHVSRALIPTDVELSSFFDKKIYFYGSDLIALALGIGALVVLKVPLRRFFGSCGAGFLWAVFLCAALSIVFSPLAHYSVLYTRLLQLLTPILLFSYLANLSEDPREKSQITALVLGAIIAAGCIQAVIATLQYGYQSPLGLRLFGEAQNFAGLTSMNGEKWIFDVFFPHSAEKLELIRASGTLPHSNVLGGFLAVSLLASYSFFLLSPNWHRLIALLIPLQVFAMTLSFSRSALFAWGLGTLFWFAHYCMQMGLKTAWNTRAFRTLLLTVLFSLGAASLILHKQILDRGGIVNYQGTLANESDEGRLHYQKTALSLIKDHPLFGTGYQQISLRTNNAPGAHNIFIYLGAELGLPALFFFFCMIGTLFWTALHARFTPHLNSLMAIFLALLFIGSCDFYPILFQQGKLLLFLMAGLLAAHSADQKRFKLAAQ